MASKDGTSDVEVEDAKESAKQLVYSGSSGSLISISIDSMYLWRYLLVRHTHHKAPMM